MALKVPQSIHENTVEHFAPKDGTSDPELAALSGAVRVLRETAEQIVEADAAARADKTQTEEAAILQSARAAQRMGEQTAKRLDKARGRILTTIENLDKRTAAPPANREVGAVQMEAETRTALRSMTEREREAFVGSAFERKDTTTIGAVLHGAPELSGMKPERHNMLRDRYRREFHPADHARHEYLKKALEATDRAGNLFVQLVGEATDSPKVRLAASASERRAAAINV